MKIGRIVSEKRKERGMTQQELADFIGVSKASVSKWENDLTYPDITLLPLLAAFFDITLDQLLDYHSQLTADEIKRIYQLLQNNLVNKSGEEVLHELRRFVRRYYSCYPFILQMGLFILNHYDYFPSVSDQEKADVYIDEARHLFLHVKKNTKDAYLINQATNYEAYTLLALKRPDEVLTLLGQHVPAYFPTESLIASAFQQKGELDRGVATLQSAIAQYLYVMMSGFTNYLQLLLNDFEKFKTTYHRGKVVADTFDLSHLHPIIWVNFQLSAAVGFAQFEQRDKVEEILTDFSHVVAKLSLPVELHGDAYFDQIESWLAQLELGQQLPRKSANLQEELFAIVLEHPVFIPYHNEPFYKKIETLKEHLNE